MAGELAVRGPEEARDLVSQNRPDAVILDGVFYISKPRALVSLWIWFLAWLVWQAAIRGCSLFPCSGNTLHIFSRPCLPFYNNF